MNHPPGENKTPHCYKGKDAGFPFPSASFLRKQEPSVLLFTDKGKNKDAGSSITNVEDDGVGQKKEKTLDP